MLKNSNAFSSFSIDKIDRAKSFYQDILGLDIEESEMGILHIHLSGGGEVIIYPKPNHSPGSFTVLSFPVNGVELSVDKLIAKGITFEQYTGEIQTDPKGISRDNGGPTIAWFKDLAGNILSVIQE